MANDMETLDAIFSRRSIRRYKETKITDDQIEKILKAAMFAPSARNEQPWHFIVVDDRKILKTIPQVHPFAEMMYQAPLAVLVCADMEIENSVEYAAIDCAAATQNILLSAHELGLGSVWLGIYPRQERMKEMIKLFNLPQGIIPISLVALGYPEEKKKTPNRFKKDRIHKNHWES